MLSMDEASPDYSTITSYIERNPAAVLSTSGPEGPHGAVVYIIPASHGTVCFVTKNQTKKYQNLLAQPNVSLTIFNEKESTTLQADGKAYVGDNSNGLKEIIMDKMTKAHATMSEWLPPVTKIENGEYAVIGIELNYARLTDYGGASPGFGGPSITEIKR